MININEPIVFNEKEYSKNAAYFVTTFPDLHWIGYVDILDGDKVVFHENLTPRTYEALQEMTEEDKIALVTAEVEEILARPEVPVKIGQLEDATAKGYIQLVNFTTPVIDEIESYRSLVNQGIEAKYAEKLTSGFVSNVSGSPVEFAYGENDQKKFHKLLTAMTANLVPYPYNVWDKYGNAVPLSQVQLQALFRDVMTFENVLQVKLHELLDQAKNAATMDELKAIDVVF